MILGNKQRLLFARKVKGIKKAFMNSGKKRVRDTRETDEGNVANQNSVV